MRRIERLINLIAALLEAPRPMTADDIRARVAGYDQDNFEAFRRTFERDKDALRAMGVPLELRISEPLEEQRLDAYVIPKDRYYLPDLDLEADELAALRIAADTVLGRGEEDAEAGLLKLSVGRDLASWSGPQVIAGANVGADEPHLRELYGALLERRPVEFSYEDARGRRSTRRVEPWSLVHRGGYWYVIGRDADAQAQRTFKLARIDSRLLALEGSYRVPAGFDAGTAVGVEAWEFGPDETSEVTVRFDPGVAWWARQNLPELPAREQGDGALEVDMPTGNRAALLGWVIGWHGAVTVVAPEAVRGDLLEHLGPWLV
ncbi:MAG: helix-turn-helix transcriptional regulator [Actinomycetota bacterium]